MAKQLPMIVKFEVKKDKIEFVKSELMKLLDPSREDEGCVLYQLHQDQKDPSIFMFYEIWETEALWKAHDVTPHVLDFIKAIEDSVISITHNKLTIL